MQIVLYEIITLQQCLKHFQLQVIALRMFYLPGCCYKYRTGAFALKMHF